MDLQADVSLYPLRTPHLSGTIDRFVAKLEQAGLRVRPGAMGSTVTGGTAALFDALRDAFASVADEAEVVLVLKVSNACPACSSTEP
jgi:uncharacterized protein YqgV (UPF0045/DUF77 family)